MPMYSDLTSSDARRAHDRGRKGEDVRSRSPPRKPRESGALEKEFFRSARANDREDDGEDDHRSGGRLSGRLGQIKSGAGGGYRRARNEGPPPSGKWQSGLDDVYDKEGSRVGVARGSRGGDACFNCGEPGHRARDCPEGGGRERRGGSDACFTCGKAGHRARDCPEGGGGRRGGGGRGGKEGGGGRGGGGRSTKLSEEELDKQLEDYWKDDGDSKGKDSKAVEKDE